MTTLELLFSVSLIFWGAIFLYLLWLHSRITELAKRIDRLGQKEKI
jgi:CcmD family protein